MMSTLDAKCVAVNSFELVSYNIDSSDFIVLLDSGNSEHYYSIFKNKKIEELGHNNIEAIRDFAQKNGLKIYYSSAETNVFGGYDFLTKVEAQENTLLELIKKNAEKGEFADLRTLSPVYIKMSQAEIGLEQDIKQNMTFRVASVQDANALSIIDEQCFDGYEKYSEESFVQELTLADRHYIVACHKNLVVGYVGLWKTGDDLNLIKIAVLPQFRKLGIGFKLMNMSADYRANGGFDKYFLEVREGNENAIKLYKKFGFKTANTREKYYSDGENCLVMFAK
jgi:ribosomal-protein-alanine N-acetyltransferase